jgi:hypothetical protein
VSDLRDVPGRVRDLVDMCQVSVYAGGGERAVFIAGSGRGVRLHALAEREARGLADEVAGDRLSLGCVVGA